MAGSPITVTALALTPVKGLRLQSRDEVQIGAAGVAENRRFFLVDDRGRMVNGKQVGDLQTVVADYRAADRELKLRFPDGREVHGIVEPGADIQVSFFSRPRRVTLIEGPFAGALSEHVGQPLRLVEAGDHGAVDRGAAGAVSAVSRQSLGALAAVAGADAVDPRRFRMLVEVDGVGAHEEDRWVGRRVRIGAALVAFKGHVGRCLTTSRDPDNGAIDLPTLDLLRSYRDASTNTEPLPFGIYGAVIHPGAVRVGDPVQVL